jgi:hypothetical protein
MAWRSPEDVRRARRTALAVAVTVVSALCGGLLAGCGTLAGAPGSESGWRSDTDQALGAALSGLGTVRLVLENQERGRLTGPYVAVAVRDAGTVLATETSSYRSAQPPAARVVDHAAAVAEIDHTASLLSRAAVVASASDRAAREQVLRAVTRQYEEVERLQRRFCP